MKQLRLYGTSKRDEPTDDERVEFEKDLVSMIAIDFQPLSLVENRGFVSFVSKYIPRFQLPSQKVLSEKILADLYESLCSNFKSVINKAEFISITTDMWSSDSNKAYITVTAHFIHDYEMKSLALATEEIPITHTSLNIGTAISNILNEWKIHEKVVTVVTDNAANMKSAVTEQLKKHHHPCVAHTLNLSVQESIKENKQVTSLLCKCRSLVTYFKHSISASYKLREMQKQMGMQELKLKQDIQTRWNSAIIMLERLLEIKLPMSAVLSSLVNAPKNLEASEWELVRDFIQILKPFLSVTEDLSAEKYPTMSRITPLIKGLQSTIKNKVSNTNIGSALQTSLLNVLSRRVGFLEKTNVVAKATFLDPSNRVG